jgi:hypothetical protein
MNDMDEKIQSVAFAWKQAGKELEINVVAPFFIKDKEGNSYLYAAFVPDFGCSVGALVLAADPPDFYVDPRLISCAKDQGYWHSIVNSEIYSVFNRTAFIETLDDWQYFGNEKNRPSWYSGKSWI